MKSERPSTSSELSGFYRLSLVERRQRLGRVLGLDETQLRGLSAGSGLSDEQANRMSENVLGVMSLPLGLCVNLRVGGRDYLVPMVIEEPSVVAAASFAAKLMRGGHGIEVDLPEPVMIGQIQLLEVENRKAAGRALQESKAELLALANQGHPHLVAAGGGARDIELHHLPRRDADDPVADMMVAHLVVDVRDAMGANAINSMCERIAPRVAELTRSRVGLRILSNLSDRRTVRVTGRVPFDALRGRGASDAASLASAIVEASVFAERDPYRAATHNKGIMNGIDAALIALGQDWRAVEAGAHAFAARGGSYTSLSRWRVRDTELVGTLEIPMAVGVVGGVARVHPTVRLNHSIAGITSAAELAGVVAAVGLAQNLSALRALAAEGIQHGHMRLHARNVAAEAGAIGGEIDEVARIIASRGEVSLTVAKQVIADRDRARLEASRIPRVYTDAGAQPLLERFSELRDEHWPAIAEIIESTTRASTPAQTTLIEMLDYHMATGGKRLRALLPLLVCEALAVDPRDALPLGAACELLHNATLVHDDVQDGDLMRRGRMTVWNRFGTPQAINLGDAMFYWAILILQESRLSSAHVSQLTTRLIRSTLNVLDGQEREFALAAEEAPSLDGYFEMVEGKTSGLFALPIAGGAAICGLSDELINGLEQAARHVGVLFQIQDDLLDIYGDKGRGAAASDIAEGKRSVLVVHALHNLGDMDRRRLLRILDLDRAATTTAMIEEAVALLEAAHAREFAFGEIRRRRQLAVAVPALDAQPDLRRLIDGMCELFVAPLGTGSPLSTA